MKKRVELYFEKRLNQELSKITFNEARIQFDNGIIIQVEWKKSRTWGNNPTATTRTDKEGFLTSGSISGCGYCKQSTAVARVLNQVEFIRYLLCKEKNKPRNLKKSNGDIFGYGSGYGIIPYIEGGVGCSCYPQIFKKLGYTFRCISSGKSFDDYQIKKGVK